MSNGGFLANPEQEPQEEKAFETNQEAVPTPSVEGEGLDEVAKAEQKAFEQMMENREEEKGFLEQASEEATGETPAEDAGAAAATAEPEVTEQKDEVMIEVEKILEEDLEPLVSGLSPQDKEKFEKKGVEVSGQIANMVRGFKLKMDKVVTLIRDWLQAIPGVNKFFLEQEAKIKADKIMDLEEAIRQDLENQV